MSTNNEIADVTLTSSESTTLSGDITIGSSGDVISGGSMTTGVINISIGTTLTLSTPSTTGVYACTGGKIKVTRNDEVIFIGSEYHVEVKEGETYVLEGVSVSEIDTQQVVGISDSLRNIVVKKDGMFDKYVNIKNTNGDTTVTADKVYDPRLTTMYTTMGLERPGFLHISDYLLPDWSIVSPYKWANEKVILNKKYYAEGLLYPKRDEYVDYGVLHNYETFGSPTITDGVMTNFGTENYIITDINALDMSVLPYEINVKFTTGSDVNAQQIIFEGENGYTDALRIQIYQTHMHPGLNNSSGGWVGLESGSTTLQANTTYWYRVTVSSTGYKFLISTDGINYTTDLSWSYTYVPNTKKYIIGVGESNYFRGSIDLNETKILRDNEILWEAITDETIKENYTKTGTTRILNGIMSDINADEYITTDINALDMSVLPYELDFKITTGSDVNAQQIIFEGNDIAYNTLRLQIYQSHFRPGLWVNGSQYFNNNATMTLSANTTYWGKFIVDGTTYKLYVSTDGETYTEDFTSTTSHIVTNTKYVIGCAESRPFYGTIDLNETKILRNGEVYWEAYGNNEPKHIISYKEYEIEQQVSLEDTLTIVGNPTIENGVVSNFSSSNSLTIPSTKTAIPMELYISFTTGSNISSMQNVIHKNNFAEVFVTGGNLKMWGLSVGEVTISSVTANTKYWLKIVVNSSNQVYYLSTTGYGDYSVEQTVNYVASSSDTGVLRFGNHNNNTGNYWRGTIDFNETYIMSSNEILWTPFTDVEVSYDVYGLCTKDFVYTGQPMTLNAYRIIYNDGTEETLLGENEPLGDNIESVTIVKSGIEIGTNNDIIWGYDNETERFVATNAQRLVLDGVPTNSNVVITPSNCVMNMGEYYVVILGTEVTLNITHEYYEPYTQTFVVNEDITMDINMTPLDGYIDVTDYTATITDDNLILSTYTGNDEDVIIPNIGETNG